jgi:predicted DNA repair protein MutK
MPSGIFSLLDDVAALMDDVAVASKIAAQKTAGILGDDLAVNAEKATGFLDSRELPVLWAITRGSLVNKLIIVPIALLLTAFFPTAIKVILVGGSVYLAYEGAEKVVDYLFHRPKKGQQVIAQAKQDDRQVEKEKIRSAVTTDFILSVEIVVIALGTVLEKSLALQIITVSVISLLATVGVYGLVALVVRMDDFGFKLIKRSDEKGLWSILGQVLVKALPLVIKFMSFIGTVALLLVSGGIFVHSFDVLNEALPRLPVIIKEFAAGLVLGLVAVVIVKLIKKVFVARSKEQDEPSR